MSTYLITGGAGFIGTNLCEQLVHDNHHVIVVDDLSAGTDPKRLPQEVVFHKLDVCDTEALVPLLAGVDIVVHLAALPRVQFSIEHPKDSQRVNVDGTLSVLEAMRKSGTKRIVYASSSAVYGLQEEMPLKEDCPPKPTSPYGLHKYYGEHLMKIWNLIHGIETVSLRFFNAYGPYLEPDGPYTLVVDRFIRQRAQGLRMTITGDGEQTRDFVHARDIARAIILASQSSAVGKGEVMNVGAGVGISVNAIAELVGGPVEYIPPRIEPRHTCADLHCIEEVLQWKPEVSLHEGVEELKRLLGLRA